MAATAALFSAACSAADAPQPDLAITGVDVIDVEAGTVLPDRTIAITDGRITGVHESADVAQVVTRVIDGEGRYLIPGLWDMHVHIRGGSELADANRRLLPLYLANGVTTVRDAGGDLADSVIVWRDRIATGEMTGPRILTAGPKLDGPTGGWDGSIRLASPDEVPAAFDSLEVLGVDYVKLYDGSMPGDVFLAAIDEARRRDLIITGHMPYTVGFRDAIAHGLNASEHLYYVFKGTAANEDSVTRATAQPANGEGALGFWNALALMRPLYDQARAQETYRLMAEAGTAVLPTLHVMRTLTYITETDHTQDPERRYLDPAFEATYQGRIRGAERSSPEARRERQLLNDRFIRMVPDMHAAGVTIIAGSDAGASNSYVYPGTSLHAELGELVAAGLVPADALRAATLDAATFMHLGDEYGRVLEGYRADLLLLTANPLEDIANTRAIETVIFGGEVLDRAMLDGLLERAATR
jgi:imidazolonepropionase-like amidohydrolase